MVRKVLSKGCVIDDFFACSDVHWNSHVISRDQHGLYLAYIGVYFSTLNKFQMEHPSFASPTITQTAF